MNKNVDISDPMSPDRSALRVDLQQILTHRVRVKVSGGLVILDADVRGMILRSMLTNRNETTIEIR